MRSFRVALVCFTIIIVSYTGVVVSSQGWNLFPEFFGEMRAMTWSGQFNVDFTCFLVLSGLWVAWRHGFSRNGLILGGIAFFGGIMFLAPFLLITSVKERGDMSKILMGVNLRAE